MAPKKRTLQALGETEAPKRAPKRAMKKKGAGKENEQEHVAVDENQDGSVPMVENPAGNFDNVFCRASLI